MAVKLVVPICITVILVVAMLTGTNGLLLAGGMTILGGIAGIGINIVKKKRG